MKTIQARGQTIVWGALILIVTLLIAACGAGDVQETPPGDTTEEPVILQDSEGRQIITVTLPDFIPAGEYLGVIEDTNGDQVTTPCELAEGTDDQLQCPLPVTEPDQEYTIQFFYYEAFVPLFGDTVGFSSDVEKSLAVPPDVILPEGYPDSISMGPLDGAWLLHYVCMQWIADDFKPDDLDPMCTDWFLLRIMGIDVGGIPPGVDMDNPLTDVDESLFASSYPDPDCEGVDAGSFWCQETDEELYVAGRLAMMCQDELGVQFEDPLTAFEDPLTAFEDPLTAFNPLAAWDEEDDDTIIQFEDPLTAFEDPLTAFEDPLTAFEDPLTAFEDPLTARNVAQLTVLYTAMRPFLQDVSTYTACEALSLLGEGSYYARHDDTLYSAIRARYAPPVPFSDPVAFTAPPVIDTSAHCSEFFQTQVTESWFYVLPGETGLFLVYRFSDGIPGVTYRKEGDPYPFIYRASLGDTMSRSCSRLDPNGPTMSCVIEALDPTRFGEEQEVALYVSGCSQPVYESTILLPDLDYSRCDFFDGMTFDVRFAGPGPSLGFYVAMLNAAPGGTWDLHSYPGFDSMPYALRATLDDQETYDVSAVDDTYERLFAVFGGPVELTPATRDFELFITLCLEPILSTSVTIGGSTPPEPTQAPCPTPVPGSCDAFDTVTCRCTDCADGYVDPDLDGVCTELN